MSIKIKFHSQMKMGSTSNNYLLQLLCLTIDKNEFHKQFSCCSKSRHSWKTIGFTIRIFFFKFQVLLVNRNRFLKYKIFPANKISSTSKKYLNKNLDLELQKQKIVASKSRCMSRLKWALQEFVFFKFYKFHSQTGSTNFTMQ